MDLLIEFARIGLGVGCVIREFVAGDLDGGPSDRDPAGYRSYPEAHRGLSPTRRTARTGFSTSFVTFLAERGIGR